MILAMYATLVQTLPHQVMAYLEKSVLLEAIVPLDLAPVFLALQAHSVIPLALQTHLIAKIVPLDSTVQMLALQSQPVHAILDTTAQEGQKLQMILLHLLVTSHKQALPLQLPAMLEHGCLMMQLVSATNVWVVITALDMAILTSPYALWDTFVLRDLMSRSSALREHIAIRQDWSLPITAQTAPQDITVPAVD